MDPQLFTAIIMASILIITLIISILGEKKIANDPAPRSPRLFRRVLSKMTVPMMITVAFCAETLVKAFLIYLGFLFAAILVSMDIKSHLETLRSPFRLKK